MVVQHGNAMKLHPEKTLISMVGLFLLVGGALAVIGMVSKDHGLLKVGCYVFLFGGCVAFLPLLFALGYFGWQRLMRLVTKDRR
jgi:hypothetical protein